LYTPFHLSDERASTQLFPVCGYHHQAEELNRFREEDAGKHWGYPYCWTEFKLPQGVGLGPGTAWAWPTFHDGGDITDEQCQADYLPPEVAMQAHSAPLGITFYEWKSPADLLAACDNPPFPETMDGYAFVAFHGSWNRDVPTGYKVVYIAMDVNGDALSGPIDLLAHEPPNAQWEDGFRPVDVDFDACGRLIVSSDGTGTDGSKIVRIVYTGDDMPPSPAEEPATTNMPSTQDECPCLPTNSPVPGDSSSSPYKRLFILAGMVVCSMLFSL
jgi:glucose/arabinose dehydrogenase